LPRIRQSDKTNGIFPSPTIVGAAGVFATAVNLTRVLDLSTERFKERLRTNSAELAQPWKARKGSALLALNRAV
jgi:ATP-dependent protease HslVU (ClpYQ) peptidase subunit